jgi:hypothetical protein
MLLARAVSLGTGTAGGQQYPHYLPLPLPQQQQQQQPQQLQQQQQQHGQLSIQKKQLSAQVSVSTNKLRMCFLLVGMQIQVL